MWRAWIGVVTAGALLAGMPAGAMAQGGGPDVTRAPSLTGLAQVGKRLDATGATWTGRSPLTATYIWLRCSSDSLWSCEITDAPRVPYYLVTANDLGKRLRVVVSVSNRDGSDYAWSSATAPVAAAPPPPTPAPTPTPVPTPVPVVVPQPAAPTVVPTPAADVPARMMRPAPVIRIRGWLTSSGAMITRLTVRAPQGVRISVRCAGAGCPRESLARTSRATRLKAFEGRLRAGTRLVIRVTRAGYIGKHTTIRIRRGKAPARRDRCLYPGSGKPAACPGA